MNAKYPEMTPQQIATRSSLLSERQRIALDWRSNGKSISLIAGEFGVGRQMASLIYRSAVRIIEADPHWTDGLSIRTINILHNRSISTREEAIKAVVGGQIRVGVTRCCGQKAYKELVAHLRITPDWRSGLSARIRNLLYELDIVTTEQAAAAVKSGRLLPERMNGYGEKSHSELLRAIAHLEGKS